MRLNKKVKIKSITVYKCGLVERESDEKIQKQNGFNINKTFAHFIF